MYGYIIVILVFVMLAVLSRKHFSKYKGEKYWLITGVFYAIAESVYNILEKRIDIDAFMIRFRKLFVASPKGIYSLTKSFFVKTIGVSIGIFFCFNLMALCMHRVGLGIKENNILEREDYQGKVKEETIELSVDEEKYRYNLNVNPMEYTMEEFKVKANEIFEELETEMLGENESLDKVDSDLNLPTISNDGEFNIEWFSSDTFVVTSYGRIVAEKNMLPAKIRITAVVKYLTYESTHIYEIVVCNDNGVNEKIEVAKEALNKIESENRTDKSIYLPEDLSGVKVSRVHKKKNAFSFVLLGIVLGVAFIVISVEKLKDKIKLRDKMLLDLYPGFVNKLWLLIGTGMNIKDALIKIVNENRNRDLLTKEIEYAINQINSGENESMVYEELGTRLGLAPYIRLSNRISQNIKKGNKDLRKLMEEEVYLALNERKEHVRKKGEEASTKLLVPMIILLGIVMVVVMFPAMMNF